MRRDEASAARRRLLRVRRAALVMMLLVLWPATALGQTSASSCVDDHKRVQTARQSGGYLAARDAAHRCAHAACPQLVREDCAAWYVDIERSVPTLIFEVRDADDRDLVDVQVSENGLPIVGAVAGRAVALDPGHHRLRFEASGHRPHELDLVVREDAKNRSVAVTLLPARAEARPVHTSSAGVPEPAVGRRDRRLASAWALSAVATAALGAYAALGITGKVAQQRLDDSSCKPHCAVSEVEYVNRMYKAADVAAGIGTAAAITATILYLTRRRESPRPVALGWDASCGERGGTLSLRGAF